jgi:hypothetical protein
VSELGEGQALLVGPGMAGFSGLEKWISRGSSCCSHLFFAWIGGFQVPDQCCHAIEAVIGGVVLGGDQHVELLMDAPQCRQARVVVHQSKFVNTQPADSAAAWWGFF